MYFLANNFLFFSKQFQAGGAAQRVIGLLDSLPDIDPYKGRKIGQDFRGDIDIEGV